MSTSQDVAQEQKDLADSSTSSSSLSSTSNSISLIKLDELSSFGATKQSRLPALIKLNPLADLNSRSPREQHQQQLQLQQQQLLAPTSTNSMPNVSGSQIEKMPATNSMPSNIGGGLQQSLPPNMPLSNKENTSATTTEETVVELDKQQQQQQQQAAKKQDDSMGDFQVVEMDEQMAATDTQTVVGPSLPPQQLESVVGDKENVNNKAQQETVKQNNNNDLSMAAASLLTNRVGVAGDQQQHASHLGDSLIEMIINLRNENQNLVKALEVNNGYVKERLDEFKRCQEEAKKRETEHQMEKADLEHNLRKVQRQNSVLSERLKSMESKLKDMKLEVSGTLSAAHSSKASSVQDGGQDNLYPQLGDAQDESFGNSALRSHNQEQPASTMQIDATSGELYNDGDQPSRASSSAAPAAMETDQQQHQTAAKEVAGMSREELSKRFDAKKVDFYAIDDPMKQCDQLEQQLNDIGKRDYEICLLQQQLNIYRQDFRLERMAKLEAKIQIEKLKNEIDRLCLERLNRANERGGSDDEDDDNDASNNNNQSGQAGQHGDGLIGKLGHHLSRKALKSAAKAAKYASKQAHLEEKAAAALARAAAAKASASQFMQASASAGPTPADLAGGPREPGAEQPPLGHGGHSRRHYHHHGRPHRHHHHAPPHPAHHRHSGRSIRGEIVSDLMSTANKAMLTGYNLASTTINTALDKLSQFEQQQAAAAHTGNRPTGRPSGAGPAPGGAQQASGPSAPPMDLHPSVD